MPHLLTQQRAEGKTNTIGECDWSNKTSVAELARRLWRDQDSHRQQIKMKVLRNIEFVVGNQWHRWDKQSQAMEPNDLRAPWEANLVFNRILPTMEQKLSQLIRRDPAWQVAPATDDHQDRAVARLSNDVLGWYWTDGLRMPEKVREAATWAMTSGVAFFHGTWDAMKGEPIMMTPEAFRGDYGGGMPQPQGIQEPQMPEGPMFEEVFGEQAALTGLGSMMTGDLSCNVLPPLDVIAWPWGIVQWKDAQIFMAIERVSVGQAAKETGQPENEVRTWAKPPREEDWQHTVVQAWDKASGNQSVWDESDDDVIYRFTLYVPKGVGGFEGGRCAVVYGFSDEAFKLDDIPTPGHELPLKVLMEKPVPGKLYGTCTVDLMIHGQQEINICTSQKANYRNRKINPTIVCVEGDTTDDYDYSNSPGRRITVPTMQNMPQVLEMPDIGTQHDRDIEQVIRLLNDTAGVSAVNWGNAEQDNVKSGKAIIALQEQNNAMLLGFAEQLDECLSQLGNLYLSLLQENVVTERIVHMIGEDNRLEVETFTRDDLRPSNYGHGQNPALVRVTSFRNLPSTQAERFALLNMMLSSTPPLLDPIKDRRRILRMIGFGDVREAFDETRVDETKAGWEIDQWRQGKEVPPPLKFDNHQVHIEEHTEWMKTPEYSQLTMMQPMMAQMIEEHMRLHEEGLIREQIKVEYTARVADFKEWTDQILKLESVKPGLGLQLFPMPIGVQMAMAQQKGQQPGKPGEKKPPQGPEKNNVDMQKPAA